MFSDKTIELEILTPDKSFFKDAVNYIQVRTLTGDMGILPGHCLLVGALDTWPIKISKDKEEHYIAVFDGFIEVTPEKVTICAVHCELPEEIDLERAERAKERAEERLANKSADIDVQRAQLALHRSLARIQTVRQPGI